jgi:hypothetical protein
MAAQREAMQQPAGTMRRQEGGAVRGPQEDESLARRDDKTAAKQEATQQPSSAMRQQEGGTVKG